MPRIRRQPGRPGTGSKPRMMGQGLSQKMTKQTGTRRRPPGIGSGRPVRKRRMGS